MTIEGSCLCRGVRYAIDGTLGPVGHCHCSMCRKAHGAAYATWGLMQPGQFRWIAGEDLVACFADGGNERYFCKQCGASLAAGRGGDVTEVALGTVDGDPGARPEAHIFVGSKAPWHTITDDLPQFDEWPPGMAP